MGQSLDDYFWYVNGFHSIGSMYDAMVYSQQWRWCLFWWYFLLSLWLMLEHHDDEAEDHSNSVVVDQRILTFLSCPLCFFHGC